MAEIILGKQTLAGRAALSSPVLLTVQTVTVSDMVSSSTMSGKTPQRYVRLFGELKTGSSMTGGIIKFEQIKADLYVESYIDTFSSDRDVYYDMKEYMPTYYQDIREAMRIIEAEAREFSRVRAQVNKVLDQYFVNSSDVALDRWERVLGITYDKNRSLDARRQFINAKLRGAGTTTLALLDNVVDSFCKADLTERATENAVTIKTTGRRGIPPNFADIKESVNDVIPAHIVPDFEFTYVPWHEIEESAMQFDDLSGFRWEKLEVSYPLEPSLTWADIENTTQTQTDIIQFGAVDTRLTFDK
ncbi:putative phage tail protein [Priestia megaterium]|uniref:putative phage tail protein n=1 Tax=Priestia megaterium TaxID=1404 RepID=UPI003457C518